MASVFIDGQAGTTGLEISRLLAPRQDIDLLPIENGERKNPSARLERMQAADVTLLCLPDAAAVEAVTLAGDRTRLLDASTAHRTRPDWAYGLPELGPGQREAISASARVANPGCYPQGFILLIRPLVEAGLLPPDAPLSVFGLSGYSGGGTAMVAAYRALTPDRAEAWNTRPYRLDLEHKHTPEMQRYAGLTRPPLFVPTVAGYYRGMLVEIPLHGALLTRRIGGEALGAVLAERYAGERFIEVAGFQPHHLTESGYLSATATNGSNRMQLMIFGNREQYLLVARYDNLGKGAAGAAVQNLNLMLGLEENLGLEEWPA